MYEENLLQDTISLFGPKPTSLFTDQKGHQGQIAIETGTLVWLQSIYNVDLPLRIPMKPVLIQTFTDSRRTLRIIMIQIISNK